MLTRLPWSFVMPPWRGAPLRSRTAALGNRVRAEDGACSGGSRLFPGRKRVFVSGSVPKNRGPRVNSVRQQTDFARRRRGGTRERPARRPRARAPPRTDRVPPKPGARQSVSHTVSFARVDRRSPRESNRVCAIHLLSYVVSPAPMSTPVFWFYIHFSLRRCRLSLRESVFANGIRHTRSDGRRIVTPVHDSWSDRRPRGLSRPARRWVKPRIRVRLRTSAFVTATTINHCLVIVIPSTPR